MKFLNIMALVIIATFMVACGDDESPALVDNATQIQTYIAANNLNALEVDDTGLYYVVSKEGDGEFPTIEDEVTVHYHGTFLDGSVFDSSVIREEPATFPLSRVISGWQIGIPKFSRGGAGKLIIPSNLAYGTNGVAGIPGNSVLIFDVELIDF